jgi:hypothetical protein
MPKFTNLVPKGIADDLAMMGKGSYGNSADILSHHLYDTIVFPTTFPNNGLVFFQKQIGGQYGIAGASSKQIFETNMLDSGKLPSKQNFIAKRIRMDLISFIEDGVYDIMEVVTAFKVLLRSSVWEVHVAGREFDWQAPGTVFGTSIQEFNQTANATYSPARIGDYNHHCWVGIPAPIVLEEQISFDVTVKFGASESGTIITDAATILATQKAAMRVTFGGTLVRSK